jgi:hypothetical protein
MPSTRLLAYMQRNENPQSVSDLTIFNPRYDVRCAQCTNVGPGVILRKVGDPRNWSTLCGRCLVLALQEVTKYNWLSQYIVWQANSELGKQLREESNSEQVIRQIDIRNRRNKHRGT